MEVIEIKNESSESNESLLKKKKMFEELYNKQIEERENLKKLKQIQNEQTKDPKELMLNIQTYFSTLYEVLKKQISNYNVEKPEVTIDEIFKKLNELKEYHISTNHALNSYDKQQYKDQLDKLEVEIYELKEKAQPRKKFAFSKKKNEVPIEKNSVISEHKHNNDQQKENTKPVDFMHQIEGIENVKNENIVLTKETLKNSWKVINNKNSNIYLNSFFDCVFIKNNRNCKIYVGPVKSSVFIDNNEECEIYVMSHQIRIHNCKNVTFCLFATSKSIIENCSQLKIKKYNYSYSDFEEDVEKCGFKNKENLWDKIQDFNWLKQEKSPNFEVFNE